MGRAGRYTLSVMAWVAAYAGWSSLIGLVVATVTGDEPREVSIGASVAFTLLGPLVPTLVALWFNDWARDGFPTKADRRLAAAQAVEATRLPVQDAVPGEVAGEVVAPPPAPVLPAPPAPAGAPPVVAANPLGVPAPPVAAPAGEGEFPVAPLLRSD